MKKLIFKGKGERGFTLIEVLIGMVLIGLVATVFVLSISIAGKSTLIADTRTTAESLAKSQMEYLKQETYQTALVNDEVTYSKIILSPEEISSGFTIHSVNRAGETVGDIIGVPWDSQTGNYSLNDLGLQKITLIIKHRGTQVLVLEEFKVHR